MTVTELPEPKAPKRVDRESARALHINWIKQLEAAFETRVIRALRAVLKEVSTSLGSLTAQGAPGEPFVSLDDLGRIGTSWDERVEKQLLPDMADVYLVGAQGTGLSLAGSATVVPEVVNREAVQWLQQSQNRLRGIGDDAWLSVRQELVAGLQQGESIDELKKRVRSTLDVVESRARMIARTEVIGATNAGSFAQAIAMGAETKTWLATEDGRTRPTHNAADDQVAPIGESFIVGGHSLRFPHDPLGPPGETINCRCTLLFDETPLCKCTPSWAKNALVAAGAPDCSCSAVMDVVPNDAVSLQSDAVSKWRDLQDNAWLIEDEAERNAVTDMLDARRRYIGLSHEDINGLLRGLEVRNEAKTLAQISNLDDAFDRIGIVSTEDVRAFRGITAEHPSLESMKQAGSKVVEDGFVSTSASRAEAEKFLVGASREEAPGVMLEIQIPKGTKVLAGADYEQELILQRGRTFTSLGMQDDGRIVLVMT